MALGIGQKIGEVKAKPGNSGAANAATAPKLRAQLLAEEIATGHAFQKHVIEKGEFADLGITTQSQFARHIENSVINNTASKQLSGGREAFWHEPTQTVVIRNPKAADGGTAFRPTDGKAFFDKLR